MVAHIGTHHRSCRRIDCHSKIWTTRMVSEYCYLCSIDRIWWENLFSNLQVSHRVLCPRVQPSEETINRNGLKWLGHVLRVSTKWLPICALFSDAGSGCRTDRGGQSVVWQKGMETLNRVGTVRLLGWSPRDSLTCLETTGDIDRNHRQWSSCNFVPLIPITLQFILHYFVFCFEQTALWGSKEQCTSEQD